ncbi:hypothetical protein ACIBCM_27555 [Streptomyces sp. NPDC051018]|uniref:hypothetical protein n=1 Tax=Streptomyces sp. NPDC051018 TaxID=3365639 RepID=UPI00379E0F08
MTGGGAPGTGTGTDASGPAPVADGTAYVRFHELARRHEGGEWIVGRMDTGDFVALPEVGVRAIELLEQGLTVDGAAERLREETREDTDVVDFVGALAGLHFVAEINGRPVPSPPPPKPSLRWLRPRHVRWTLSPAVPVVVAALVAAALVVLVRRPDLSLGYRSLLWHPRGSAVIALSAAAGWLMLVLHECAHLAVARATGVPARIRLGTRLQFLVMQTDISGIELAPRRHRITAYLAGMALNLTVSSAAVLCASATGPGTTARRVLLAVALIVVLSTPFQFMVFMRTDVYFVLQDVLGCRNLYGDGLAYARYTARRLRYAARRRGKPPKDPTLGLPARERRAVRAYTPVLVVGTALCLAFLAAVTLPADLTLIGRALNGWGADRPLADKLDAAAVLLALGGVHTLWAVTWWRNRRRARRLRASARGA